MANSEDIRTQGIKFDVIITKEGVNKAQTIMRNKGQGWHLTPKIFAIADYSDTPSSEISEFNNEVKMIDYLEDVNNRRIWHTGTFSAIYPKNNNEILLDITVPANKTLSTDEEGNTILINNEEEITDSKKIDRIYIIFENYEGRDAIDNGEFIFAIARPSSSIGDLYYIPGTVLGFKFLFALEGLDSESVFIECLKLEYTWSGDIESHNRTSDAHSNLLARDGSRTITNNLFYGEGYSILPTDSTTIFDNVDDKVVVTKGYVNKRINDAKAYTDSKLGEIQNISVYIDGV